MQVGDNTEDGRAGKGWTDFKSIPAIRHTDPYCLHLRNKNIMFLLHLITFNHLIN